MCLQDAEAPLILDGLAQAERYSKDKVAASAELGCHAYNRDGAIVETFTNTEVYERFHGQPAAKRNLWVDSACLVAGVAFISLDVWRASALSLEHFSECDSYGQRRQTDRRNGGLRAQ
jgi:hypothetical protein